MSSAEVALPWAERADASCFGCASANPVGLGLRFRPDGFDGTGLVTELCLGRAYESYPGVVHGGIVALVCDETMGNLVVLRHHRPAVTTSLRLRYVGVVATGVRYRCHATLPPADGAASLPGRAEIRDQAGDLVATASAAYRIVPADPTGRPVVTVHQGEPT